MTGGEIRFEPFDTVTVDLGFWRDFSDKKGREWKFGTKTVDILGFYEGGRVINNTTHMPSRFQIVPLSREVNKDSGRVYQKGRLHIYETLSELKNSRAVMLSADFPFELHVYGDLKHFKFHYAFYYLQSPIKGYFSNDKADQEIVIKATDPHSKEDCFGFPVANEIYRQVTKFPANVKLEIQRFREIRKVHLQLEETTLTEAQTEIKFVDISGALDPEKLAEEAARLNLNLMTWRMAPGLDLDCISEKRYLILGSGTLGCNILRSLIAWGARKFTLVDNGRVSLGNPARQSLITFEDRGKFKAEAVKENALKILPFLNIEAKVFTIPVPNKSDFDRNDLEEFSKIIERHDMIFLLTDTRESRWLPTVLATAYNKLAITIALGFDDFLVTVHDQEGGCYFCQDPYSVPGEINGGEKPLDLQCTVSRPGISLIASGLAIETLMSILQERKEYLGEPLSHIRGFLKPHSQISSYHTCRCPTCPACGPELIKRVNSKGFPFLEDCLSNLPKVVKELYPKEDEVELKTF